MQKGCFHLLIRAAIGHRIPSHQHLDYGSSNPRHWAWIPQSPHNRHISFISLDFELSKGQLPLGYSQPVSEPFHTHSQGNDPPTDNRVLPTLFPEACVLEGFIHKQWNKHFLMALQGKKNKTNQQTLFERTHYNHLPVQNSSFSQSSSFTLTSPPVGEERSHQ